MDKLTFEDTISSCKINVFKDTESLLAGGGPLDDVHGSNPVAGHFYYLAGKDLADVTGT